MTDTSHGAIGPAQKFSLGFGYFTVFFLGQGIPILAIPHYQMTLGVNPAVLGLLMAGPLFVASCFGVWFGHLSDKVWTRFGRRRPFMALAACVTSISYGLLWMPPATDSDLQLVMYFGGLSLVFQLASVVYTVSLNSLVYESSPDSLVRTRLIGFTTYFVKLGSLCYQWLYPLSTLTLIGGLVLGVAGVGWLLALVVFLVMGLLPVMVRETAAAPLAEAIRPPAFVRSLRAALANKTMVFVLTLTLLQMGGVAYAATMDYYLLVYFVHGGDIARGAIDKGLLSTAYALVSIVSVPLVVAMAQRWGRLQALALIYVINACGGLLKWFLFVPGVGQWLLLDALLCGTLWTAMVILIPSMMADLAQQQGQAERSSYAGMFASIHGWTLSLSAVAVLLLSGLTLSFTGFDASLAGQQSATSVLAMRLILTGGSVLFSVIPLLLVMRWQADKNNYRF